MSPSSLVSDTGGVSPLKAWNMTDTALVHHLVLAIGGAHLGPNILRDQLGRHRVVDIDDAAPDLGMLQRECAAQPPEDRMCRVRPITFVDRLGIAGEDHQFRRRRHPGKRCDKPPDRVEQAVTRRDIEVGDGTDGA